MSERPNDDLIQVEWSANVNYSIILTREQYDEIKDDLENGLAEYEEDADFSGLTRDIIDVAEGA